MAIEGIFYIYAQVTDLQRAKQFYGETLGWKLHTDEQLRIPAMMTGYSART